MISVVGLFVSAIAQTKLCITTDKTTSLVFPFAIKPRPNLYRVKPRTGNGVAVCFYTCTNLYRIVNARAVLRF